MKLSNLARITGLLLLVSVPWCAGCGKGASGGNGAAGGSTLSTVPSSQSRNLAPVSAPATESTLVGAVNAFGVDLLANSPADALTTVVTPFSASFALAQLRAGAAGTTLSSINDVLHISGATLGVDASFNALDLAIRNSLSLASAGGASYESVVGWTQAGYGFRLSYLDNLAENYGLVTGSADFAHSAAAFAPVDQWTWNAANVSASYSGSPNTRFLLGGSVKLSLPWQAPFDPALTAPGWFRLLDLSFAQVNFLHLNAFVNQAAGDGYLALALPLVGGQQFLAVLPAQGRFAEIQAGLSADRWQQIAQSLAPAQADLALPVFSATTSLALDLGVAATRGSADFSGVDGSTDLFVSAASHASRFALTGAGLEAGSVTLLELEDAVPQTWTAPGGGDSVFDSSDISISIPPQVTITLGRPFLFAVRDTQTGTFLFLGRVLDPRSP